MVKNRPKPDNKDNGAKTTARQQYDHKAVGIVFQYNRQRPKRPFLMRWGVGGVKKTQSFATEKERELAARAMGEKRQRHGEDVLDFDPREWRQWVQAKELLAGQNPLVAIAEWKAMKSEKDGGLPTKNTGEAIKEYLEERQSQGVSADGWRHMQSHLRDRFGAQFGGVPLGSIKASDIVAWLDGLVCSKGRCKGKPVTPLTRKDHRKNISVFFDWCLRHEYVARNVIELVPVPRITEKDVKLLMVEEGRRLFAVNKDEPVTPRMALEAFGFLRASSAGRITSDKINFSEKGIRMLGFQHKSQKTKYRQGHPDNLWAWLALATEETWALSERMYAIRKAEAFVRAGISEGSENRLRKTCLSAHLAWKKNQPLTSYLAQHDHTSTTDTYLGAMSEKDGEAWFSIMPS